MSRMAIENLSFFLSISRQLSFYLIFARHQKKKKPYNNINIWGYRHRGGYLCKHSRRQACSLQPQVGWVKQRKPSITQRAVPTKQSVVGTDLYPNIVYCMEGAQRLREAPAKVGERSQRRQRVGEKSVQCKTYSKNPPSRR